MLIAITIALTTLARGVAAAAGDVTDNTDLSADDVMTSLLL